MDLSAICRDVTLKRHHWRTTQFDSDQDGRPGDWPCGCKLTSRCRVLLEGIVRVTLLIGLPVVAQRWPAATPALFTIAPASRRPEAAASSASPIIPVIAKGGRSASIRWNAAPMVATSGSNGRHLVTREDAAPSNPADLLLERRHVAALQAMGTSSRVEENALYKKRARLRFP
jgi:hypothetical protein